MGGPGPGHESERARQARLVNMAKARAARKREPLPWRSGLESRIIEQLVWQWWLTASDAGIAYAEQQLPPTLPNSRQLRRDMSAYAMNPLRCDPSAYAIDPLRRDMPTQGFGAAGKPWAKYRVARFLGVSHTWVNKLVKRFEADPERMRRRMAAFAPASVEKLERAREETRRQREYGWLRGGIRWRRVKFEREGKKRTAVVATESERRRREAEAKGRPEEPLVVPYAEVPAWARSGSMPKGAAVAVRRRPRRFFRH